jgi:hypothetical protein
MSLVGTLVLGCLITTIDIIWQPAYEAISVDAILSPEERHDRNLIEVVQRTHEHNGDHRNRFPFWVLGAITVAASILGLVGLKGAA